MADAIKSLTQKRGTIKTQLSKFRTYVEKLSDKLDDDARFKLSLKLTVMEGYYGKFSEIQLAIEGDEKSDNKKEEKERDDFENMYFDAIDRARKLLATNPDTTTSANVTPASTANHTSGAILPKIELPKFVGLLENWIEFRDMFIALVDSNSTLTDVQKFYYLRLSLGGEAAATIKSCAISNQNYATAWKSLQERYNNERILVQHHLKALFSLQPILREGAHQIRVLVDEVSKHISALESLGESTNSWDTLIIYIISSRLEKSTARDWEEKCQSDETETKKLSTLLNFLRDRSRLIETIESERESINDKRNHVPNESRPRFTKTFVATETSCTFCKGTHYVSSCPILRNLNVEQRIEKIKSSRCCFNCLRPGHSATECRSSNCRTCGKRHHTLLHRNANTYYAKQPESQTNLASEGHPLPHSEHIETNASQNFPSSIQNNNTYTGDKSIICSAAVQTNVLLPTAVVKVKSKNNEFLSVRVLLDSGAQSNFITESFAKRIGADILPFSTDLIVIARTNTRIKSKCNIFLRSTTCDYSLTASCLIIPMITGDLPNFNVKPIKLPSFVRLADPTYNIQQHSEIDILIGSTHFWHLLSNQQLSNGPNQPVLRETKFGWIVSGCIPIQSVQSHHTLAHCATQTVESQLAKFWELEEVNVNVLNPDAEFCEEHGTTTKRNDNGRFVVSIPFKQDPYMSLGESYERCYRQFVSLERRLVKNPLLYNEYRVFMNEYIQNNHMTEEIDIDPITPQYIMPHHAVTNTNSETTKLRVVFNASSPSSSGLSLNDLQPIGPQLQQDLVSILLRFRKYKVAVCADIQKMYRQIEVRPDQRKFQRILWRNDENQPVKVFSLTTVTYGTTTGSYLAIRCLFQLALEVENTMPTVARAIREDFYVDDFLSGTDSVDDVVHLCERVTQTLKSACMPLHTWVSNETSVLSLLDANRNKSDHYFGDNEQSKTLGLLWCPTRDTLAFQINFIPYTNVLTKRLLLSLISQIFDPLGVLSPVVMQAKIILRNVWLEKLSWDEEIPSHICQAWNEFYSNLTVLSDISIPRYVCHPTFNEIELHGFAN